MPSRTTMDWAKRLGKVDRIRATRPWVFLQLDCQHLPTRQYHERDGSGVQSEDCRRRLKSLDVASLPQYTCVDYRSYTMLA
jgi:hypothetical protein